MINFNHQDGYSVNMPPKPSVSPHISQDEDENVQRVQPKLDNFNFIQDNHRKNSNLLVASSVLLVHEVQYRHAGNYTCAPSNTRPTNIIVHVLKGKYTFLRVFLSPSDYLKPN